MFRRLNNIFRKPAVILPILGIFTFVSCKKDSIAIDIAKKSTKEATSDMIASNVNALAKNGRSYKGEDFFEAMFFLQGAASHELPSLDSYVTQVDNFMSQNNEATKQIKDIRKETIKEIRKSDPTFFDRFENTLKSDNLFAIETIMNEGAIQFRRALLLNQKYGNVFQVTDSLSKDSLALKSMQKLDLSTADGKEAFNKIVEAHVGKDQNGNPSVDIRAILPIFVYALVVFVSLAAIFFTYAVALNMAFFITIVFVYEIYFVGAAKGGGVTKTTKDILIAEIADTF